MSTTKHQLLDKPHRSVAVASNIQKCCPSLIVKKREEDSYGKGIIAINMLALNREREGEREKIWDFFLLATAYFCSIYFMCVPMCCRL